MDIVIIANFCMDFSETDNGRFSYLASRLSEKNKVEIVTSSFYHVTKKYRGSIGKKEYKITFLNEPGYKKNVSVKRFFSHFIWGNNVINYLKSREKPDVIYCAIPSLTAPYLVSRYCENEKIKFIIDIQDLWPEAFQMILNIPIISNAIFGPLKIIANAIYKRADEIVAVSQTYIDRALSVNRKIKEGHAIFLGTSLEVFDRNSRKKINVNKTKGEIWVAYCGTLGKSYDIKCVIDALCFLNNPNITLIVMGDGPDKEMLIKYANDKNVKCKFYGRLPYDDMCSLLVKCDMTVNPIIKSSVASIINKHADYAASGLPVISTQKSEEYIQLIAEYDMGYSVEPSDVKGVASCIDKLANNEKLRERMGMKSRLCAEEKFDRKNTYNEIIRLIKV